ncbi:MSMEG_0567/Sll0786 family nitrogen starvation N-acetyltransferase [Algiphilus sp.]|uniref:MSMEG_0567/Sll0786 family nitrogen starvation N-acetyltransferase n=1 Tax=Algiphilus sp. TaxID=1872431 RepID=UPI0025B8EFD4|nr:MSMEG_0567/Sll0786 family nitrogen starvation N-acetyltransferase [Algiphilus sp.]
MFDAPPFRFLPGEYRVRRATAAWEHAGCARLRRAVFCDEQGIFDGDDRDAIDAHAIPLAAIACVAGQPEVVVGTVRIHRDADGMWWGSRLAVHADYRRSAWLGSALIRFAVGHAHALGCRRFLAQVQEANVPFFVDLHWRTLRPTVVRGRPHRLMAAELAHYPPCPQPDIALYPAARDRRAVAA